MKLNIPSGLIRWTENNATIEVQGTTIREMKQNLRTICPALTLHILKANDDFQPFIVLFVNGEDARLIDENAKLNPQDELTLIAAIAGG